MPICFVGILHQTLEQFFVYGSCIYDLTPLSCVAQNWKLVAQIHEDTIIITNSSRYNHKSQLKQTQRPKILKFKEKNHDLRLIIL